jgi:hypothetical protein
MTDIILNIAGEAFGVPMDVDLQLAGGPFSFTLKTQQAVSIKQIWDTFSDQLESVTGVSLPTIPPGPWDKIMDVEIIPSLWITPDSSGGNTSAFLQLILKDELSLGTHHDYGPIDITIEPDITITGILIGYDGAGDGLTVKAKIKTPTTPAPGSNGQTLQNTKATPTKYKEQLVNFPFPLPSQDSLSTFRLNYLGIGQRVGPTVQVTADGDPMATIFDQLETQLIGNDPETIITQLAKDFYQPDRDWFIAADLELRELRLRVLFNDPVMYGLEISIPMTTPPSFFSGLLFEILYQKLGPNLGVYYGALTLPYGMRRIPLEGFILILPGFSIWIYTNGDFRINVGWPISPNNSIGISFDILTGWAGFYLAKLRSGDNPGAKPSVNYNPILEFGIGVSVGASVGISSGPLSASLSASITATFQGLLAWESSGGGSSISDPPDHYWFAGTASIAVVLQGSVNLEIIKASVLVSFTATAGVAFETGYQTTIPVSAAVKVRVSIKVVFVTIHLSFHTTVKHTFYIGNGKPASINGPLAPGLNVMSGPLKSDLLYAKAKKSALSMRSNMAPAFRPLHEVQDPERFRSFSTAPIATHAETSGSTHAHYHATPAASTNELDVAFILQPTVVYDEQNKGTIHLIASLMMDCPAPDDSPLSSPGAATGYELLIIKIVRWLLTFAPSTSTDTPLSTTLQQLANALGSGAQEPGEAFGGRDGFVSKLKTFFAQNLVFTIRGVQSDSPAPFDVAAVLPIFDELQLQAEGNPIEFADYNRTPSNYSTAVDMYFDNMGLIGSNGPGDTTQPLTDTDASPATGPSMASYLFGDYYLMIARYVVSMLISDAQQYEAQHETQLKQWAKSSSDNSDADPFDTISPLSHYASATNPNQELTYLLDHLAYSSIAGFGSRYLMSGLQLPEPSKVPADLTPEDVAKIPIASLFQLSGQQYSVNTSKDSAEATLSLSPGHTLSWIKFEGNSPDLASARFDLPSQIPEPPNPNWIEVASPASPPAEPPNTIVLQPLAPLTATPMGFNLKNSVAWSAPNSLRTLFNFPQPLNNLLQVQNGLQLALNAVDNDEATSSTPVNALTTLQIRLSITQVAGSRTDAIAASPSSPVPPSSPSGSAYLPNLYQLNGTDEDTRELIYQALQADLSEASISLLYQPPGSDNLVSDDLDPSVLLAKMNLSTLNQVEQVSFSHRVMLMSAPAIESDSAQLSDVKSFLRLVWELSVVRASGYYLYYKTKNGEGLPADLFSDTATPKNSPTDPAQTTVPGTASGTANFTIVVQFAKTPSSRVNVAPYQNSLWINAHSDATTVISEVQDKTGAPVLCYQPSYAAGNLGFAATWTPATEPSPAPLIPVNSLYHLMQYQITGKDTDYSDSVWSLPIGPTAADDGNSPDATDDIWQLRQLIPLLPFFHDSTSPSPSLQNPYSVIGHPANLKFRLCDLYGNPLSQQQSDNFTPLYTDLLIGLGEWPGLQSSYYFKKDSNNSAQVQFELEFDPDIVDIGASPNVAGQTQWETMRAKYQLIIHQLTDPNTTLTANCSLVATKNLGNPQPYLLPFAQQILDFINSNITGSPTVHTAPSSSLSTQFHLPLLFSDLSLQPDDIVDIGVSISLQRETTLVDPTVLQKLSQVQQLSYTVLAKLSLPDLSASSSPSSSKNHIAIFARYFEQAFHNFDQLGGKLKLAQRAGTQVSNSSNTVPDLWSVRFSKTQGFDASFNDDLVYFALRPLNIKPRNGFVNNIQYNDIDMDAWAAAFFNAVDHFLSPQLGVAVALLDEKNNTQYFDQLMQSKQVLAKAVPTGLVPVLEKDMSSSSGDETAAQERLQQAMLDTLSSAYTVSTVIQARASVSVKGNADNVSPQKPPQLYGVFSQPGAGSPDSASNTAKLYQFSPVELALEQGEQWSTSLLTVSQPGDQSNIELPLQYNVSYLQHDFETNESYDGYVPSSWIKFALPDEFPLLIPITENASPAASPQDLAVIPIPLPFEPPLPILVSQIGQGVTLSSPSASPDSLREEILQALQWRYQVMVSLDLASQDEFYFDITKNVPLTNNDQLSARNIDARLTDQLFEALATFNQNYPELSAQFNLILQEAYSSDSSPSGQASDIISAFYTLVDAVATAWPTNWNPPRALFSDQNEIDHFRLTFDSNTAIYTLELQGQTDNGHNNPTIWPTLIMADGSSWTPDRTQAKQNAEGWWVLTYPLNSKPDLSPLQLSWEPLAILDYQSADFDAWTVRNADLVPQQKTNPLFIYQTDETSFPDPIIPLIERDTLPKSHVGAISESVLEQILNDIIEPLSSVSSTGVNPVINLQANYAYQLVPGPSGQAALMAESPVLLVSALELDSASPSTVAHNVAMEIWNWYQTTNPPTTNAQMEFAFTLFGTVNDQQLPLVQINKIPVVFASE